jgi:predicted enzyme related to lactoylglutathione lyase
MSTRDIPWAPGTPCWVDLISPDPEASSAFYSAVFGWDVQDMGEDFGHYRIARIDGHRVGGIGSPPPGQEQPAVWVTYLATADADATADAITAAGGAPTFPPMDVGPQGRMFLATDPAGLTFGLWQAGATPGAEIANEPGAFTWNECMTRDFAGAKDFYGTVFGYDWQDLSGDGFTYATFSVDGRPVGGLGGLTPDVPEDVPAGWTAYFKVADASESAAKIVEHGGAVVREPWDTPFGTIAVVTDPSGAAFNVMADNDESIANAAAAEAE